MRKLNLIVLITIVTVFTGFSSCEDSSGGDDSLYEESHNAISLGDTLTLSGTVTKYFSSPSASWGGGKDAAAAPYRLINTTGADNDGAVIDLDGDGDDSDDSFTFSLVSPAADLNTVAGWGFTSSVSDVDVYSTEVQDDNGEQVHEFLLITDEYALWYEYIYASKDTVISGTAPDGDETYIFDDVSVTQGWNKVISRTSDGETFTLTGGTLSGTAWTFMKN